MAPGGRNNHVSFDLLKSLISKSFIVFHVAVVPLVHWSSDLNCSAKSTPMIKLVFNWKT